jgi:nucleoid-associated protein YgaU
MKLTPWLVLLSLSLASCSGSKSAQKVNEETPQIELSDADEFIENPTEEANAATADSSNSEALVEDSATEVIEEPVVTESEPVLTDTPDSPVVSEMDMPSSVAAPVVSNDSGSTKQYIVQKNETLMIIAFKLYGNYERWKDIASQNRGALKGNTSLRAGMTLNYIAPAEEFVWNPQGSPYLIRTGDTLVGISKEVYATMKKWKLIWENNRPLIKDPNKIYAGFTIYYPESGREVANEL